MKQPDSTAALKIVMRHRKEVTLVENIESRRQHQSVLFINLCVWCLFPCPVRSVLWLDVLTVAGGRRLSAFGCQNGCVGLALVSQTGPGEVTWSSHTVIRTSLKRCTLMLTVLREKLQPAVGETSRSNSIIQSADACCARSTNTLIHSFFHWFTLAFFIETAVPFHFRCLRADLSSVTNWFKWTQSIYRTSYFHLKCVKVLHCGMMVKSAVQAVDATHSTVKVVHLIQWLCWTISRTRWSREECSWSYLKRVLCFL